MNTHAVNRYWFSVNNSRDVLGVSHANNAPQVATVIPSFQSPIDFVVTRGITVARLRPLYGLFLVDIDILIAIACGTF